MKRTYFFISIFSIFFLLCGGIRAQENNLPLTGSNQDFNSTDMTMIAGYTGYLAWMGLYGIMQNANRKNGEEKVPVKELIFTTLGLGAGIFLEAANPSESGYKWIMPLAISHAITIGRNFSEVVRMTKPKSEIKKA